MANKDLSDMLYENVPTTTAEKQKDLGEYNSPAEHGNKNDLVHEDNKIKIGIVGHGFVGSAVDYAFTHPFVDKFIVDPKYDTNIDELIDYDQFITFVCAPTPSGENGVVDASIVEDAVLKLMEDTTSIVVIKSTVTPDVIDRLCNSLFDDDVARLVYNPEFLTESSSKEQFVMAPYHIVGGLPKMTK